MTTESQQSEAPEGAAPAESSSADAVAQAAQMAIDFDRYVPFYLNTLSNKISAGASKIYLQDFRIGITEWRILAVLGAFDGMNAQGLAAYTGMDKSVVSRALRGLEKHGLIDVAIDRADHRRRALELTDKGRALRNRMQSVALGREQRLMDGFSEAERGVLIGMLKRLLENMALVDPDDVPMRRRPRSG